MKNRSFDDIISFSSLLSAWERFRKGKSKRKDVQMFERHLEDNLFALQEDLVSGTYHHGEYHEFHIFDPKHRIIHKATVRDRIVHHLLCMTLGDIFEPSFISDSYSCRNEKGTHAAVCRLQTFVRKVSKNYHESCWVLKFDIRRFFDSVDHEILLSILAKKIDDEGIMCLVSEVVSSFAVPIVETSPLARLALPDKSGGGVNSKTPKAWSSHWEFNIATVCQYLHGCV